MTIGFAASAATDRTGGGPRQSSSSATARILLIDIDTINEKARFPGLLIASFRGLRRDRLDRLDVGGGRTLGALLHVERHLLRLFQGLVAVHLNRAVVGEQILAAVIRRAESETLGVVEPLHCACCHCLIHP